MKKIISFSLVSSLIVPVSAHARTFKQIVSFIITDIVEKTVLPFLLSLSIIAFLWGVFQYIRKVGEAKVKEGRDMMVYGLVGLAAILSVWGLVRILIGTFLPSDIQIIDQEIRQTEQFDWFRTGV